MNPCVLFSGIPQFAYIPVARGMDSAGLRNIFHTHVEYKLLMGVKESVMLIAFFLYYEGCLDQCLSLIELRRGKIHHISRNYILKHRFKQFIVNIFLSF